MNTQGESEAKVLEEAGDRNVLFWVLLGPLSALLTISVLFLKAPADLYFLPVAALSGIVLTWAMRLKGFLLSLLVLFALSFSQIVWFGAADALWFLGAVAALASSFLVTLLTLDQADEVVQVLQKETMNYVQTFANLSGEKESLDKRLIYLQRSVSSKESEIQSLEKVYELARVELLSTLSKQEELIRDLTEEARVRKNLEDDLEQANTLLKQHEMQAEKRVEQLQALSKEMSDQIDTLSREKDLLESMLNKLQAELEAQPEPVVSAPVIPGNDVGPAIDEIGFTEPEFRRLYGQHKQLREQFADKSLVLDQTRKELFLAQEKAAVLERELAELEFKEIPVHSVLSQALEDLSKQHEEALQEIATLESLLSAQLT